jgi:hypothetical protein
MTFTLLELVAVLATIGLAVAVVFFVHFAKQLTRTAAELENTARRVSELIPAAQRVLGSAESELEELRILTHKTSQVAGHVHAVTGEASAATVNLLRGLEGRFTNRYGALVAGARAGLAVIKGARGNGSDRDPVEAHDSWAPNVDER